MHLRQSLLDKIGITSMEHSLRVTRVTSQDGGGRAFHSSFECFVAGSARQSRRREEALAH
jgi:hypothetical protein